MYNCMCLYCFQGESNDSGTESDGDVLDVDKHRPLDLDMETSESWIHILKIMKQKWKII